MDFHRLVRLQIMIVGVMVLIPLIFTEALPKGHNDVHAGGPATATTATAASSGSSQQCQADSDRYRERRAAHAY